MFGNIQNFVLKHFEYVSIDLLLLWREKCQRAHSGAESCWRAPALTPASFGPSGKSHEHCLIPHLRHGTQYLPPTGDTGLSHLQFSRLLEARRSSAPSCTHRATPGTFGPLPTSSVSAGDTGKHPAWCKDSERLDFRCIPRKFVQCLIPIMGTCLHLACVLKTSSFSLASSISFSLFLLKASTTPSEIKCGIQPFLGPHTYTSGVTLNFSESFTRLLPNLFFFKHKPPGLYTIFNTSLIKAV